MRSRTKDELSTRRRTKTGPSKLSQTWAEEISRSRTKAKEGEHTVKRKPRQIRASRT